MNKLERIFERAGVVIGVLIILFTFSTAEALDEIHLNVRSWHHVEGSFNEENWGVGFAKHLNSEWAFEGGHYVNSYYDNTFYAGIRREWRSEYFAAGVAGYVLTGYGRKLGYELLPVVAPYVSVGPETFNVRVHTLGAVSSLQLRASF